MRIYRLGLPAFGAVMLLAGAGGSQPGGGEPLQSLWERELPGVTGLAVSGRGERVFAVRSNGILNGFDQTGRPLWERAIEGVDSLVSAADGRFLIAYAKRGPYHPKVHLLDGSGRQTAVLGMPGPVEAVALSRDPRFAAIAVGSDLIFCHFAPDGVKRRVIPLGFTPTLVRFGAADSVFVADHEHIRLVKSTGRVIWERLETGADQASIAPAAGGRLLAIAIQRPRGRLEVAVVDPRKGELWSALRLGRSPRVHPASDGQSVILSYEHRVEHDRESRYERRLARLFADRREWTRGGSFSAPLCVAVDPECAWAVALDTQAQRPGRPGHPRFVLFGEGGQRRWTYTSRAAILIATASTDGRTIAAYRTDQSLEVIRVTALL